MFLLILCVYYCLNQPPSPTQLMHVNSQWDLEYKDLNEAFRRYRIDSKQAEGEHQSEITRLREVKEVMAAEIRELKSCVNHRDREIVDLRTKIRALEDEVRASRLGRPVVSQERVRELEEESHMLRQQVSRVGCVVWRVK